jgi:hypothetical protein
VFVNDVEDFQVEYWVDTLNGYPDGVMTTPREFPIHVLNFGITPNPPPPGIPPDSKLEVTHLGRIRQVRISMIGRSDLADEAGRQLVRGRRPALANRPAAGTADAFTRRMYTVNVLPRNLIDDETLEKLSVP